VSGKKTVNYVPLVQIMLHRINRTKLPDKLMILNAVSNAVVEDKTSVDWKKTTTHVV
jgi:hypothetical protein